MRRTVLTLVATVAGLVLLLSFKTTGSRTGRLVALAPAAPPAGPSPTSGPTTAAPPAATPRTVVGAAITTPYGPVQLRVQLSGTRILAITPLQLPSGYSRDYAINSYAVPVLTQEAMTAQSARIDAVSGATYTSDGYAQSLQSALDQAVR